MLDGDGPAASRDLPSTVQAFLSVLVVHATLIRAGRAIEHIKWAVSSCMNAVEAL
jgi:hypothetical protein